MARQHPLEVKRAENADHIRAGKYAYADVGAFQARGHLPCPYVNTQEMWKTLTSEYWVGLGISQTEPQMRVQLQNIPKWGSEGNEQVLLIRQPQVAYPLPMCDPSVPKRPCKQFSILVAT